MVDGDEMGTLIGLLKADLPSKAQIACSDLLILINSVYPGLELVNVDCVQ